LGRRAGLPDDVLHEMDETIRASGNNKGMKLCLALNYGGREEITDAVKKIATRVMAGELTPGDIDEQLICDSLYTANLPDPDLLVRTANERRISNFLLWQISYAEIHVCETLWPDFSEAEMNEAIRDFAGRQRRFGCVTTQGDDGSV